jgi:mono/diheme cytochrome c family protein
MTPPPDRLRRAPREREYEDPGEEERPIPLLVIGLALVLVAWGSWAILSLRGTADPALGDRRTVAALAGAPAGGAADGAQLYAGKCAGCHQVNGQGIAGVFPPLAGSPWVVESETRLVQILLHGIQGPIEVAGTTYNGLMPPWKSLPDEEIAAIATYVRTAWGNAASPVTVGVVQGQRAATADRAGPWTGGAELAGVP